MKLQGKLTWLIIVVSKYLQQTKYKDRKQALPTATQASKIRFKAACPSVSEERRKEQKNTFM
jgi:hypothetical protein